MSAIANKKAWKDALDAVVHQRTRKSRLTPTPFPKGVERGPLKSKLFSEADRYVPGVRARLQACADNHMSHIQFGHRGMHVAWVKSALHDIVLPAMDDYIPVPDLAPYDEFGAATRYSVLKYKRKNTIINRDYQDTADDIIGIKTIRMIDFHLQWLGQ